MARPAQITPDLVRHVRAEFAKHHRGEKVTGPRLQRFARRLRDRELPCHHGELLARLDAMGKTLGRTASWTNALRDPAEGSAAMIAGLQVALERSLGPKVAQRLSQRILGQEVGQTAWGAAEIAQWLNATVRTCETCQHFKMVDGGTGECRLYPRYPVVIGDAIESVYPIQSAVDSCGQHRPRSDYSLVLQGMVEPETKAD